MDHLHAILNNPPALAGVLYAAYIYYAFIRKSIACRVDVWPSEKSAASVSPWPSGRSVRSCGAMLRQASAAARKP